MYEANQPPIVHAGVAVKAGQATVVKLVAEQPGSVAGKVTGWPIGWGPYLRVVAFTASGFLFETTVAANGTFQFPALPPGEYGLKVGHDGIADADRPPRPLEAAEDPWKRAVRVRVKPGAALTGVELTTVEK